MVTRSAFQAHRAQPSSCTHSTSIIGVITYPIGNGRDLADASARDRFLSLRGPPGRIPSACQPPWSSQTLTASTDNTILIQSEVRSFHRSPGRGRAKVEKDDSAVHKQPPCPVSTAVACPASRSSSSVRFWLARTPPRAGLKSFLDDQLDEQQTPAVEAYRRAATTKSSAYNH
jgi:hypothetical protein